MSTSTSNCSLPPAPWTRANGDGSEEPIRSIVCAIYFAAQAGSQLDAVYGPLLGKAIRDVTQNLRSGWWALDALSQTAIGLIPLFLN
jgi:hypothetical protein